MTEVHRTSQGEVKRQQLRLTVDGPEFARTLVGLTKPQYRDQLPNSLYMYSQAHYDLAVNPRDRRPEDVSLWSGYVKGIAEIGPYHQFNLKHPASDDDKLIGVFYDERADLMRLLLPVMMGGAVLRRVVAPPMFERASDVVDIKDRSVLPVVYTVPRPITAPRLFDSYLRELKGVMRSEAGATVNELTVVGPDSFSTPVIVRPPRIRYNDPWPPNTDESNDVA